ncbi:SPFH domain-containing protein [Kitasatospora sp. NPDC094011]|uniref:SPFH domain-containing protein n=1 Tax=Kitasatospora sp. NPDC094011 TaxID=3364090 RepID=UPI003802732F
MTPPTADPNLVERSGPALAAWWAVLVGLLGSAAAGWVLWRAGVVPFPRSPAVPAGSGTRVPLGAWELGVLAAGGIGAALAFGGLTHGREGSAWVLTLFGRYRGTVRRTGPVWISPLVLRRRADVRLRHWRSEPVPVLDARGVRLRVVVLVVWKVRDTARALLAVDDHGEYLREQVEAALSTVLATAPARVGDGNGPAMPDAGLIGEELTRIVAARCSAVGLTVFSVQPARVEYDPAIASAIGRAQAAEVDARHQDLLLGTVVDAVEKAVKRLSDRGLLDPGEPERVSLARDLAVAFYTARTTTPETG